MLKHLILRTLLNLLLRERERERERGKKKPLLHRLSQFIAMFLLNILLIRTFNTYESTLNFYYFGYVKMLEFMLFMLK